jgi:intein-encoded DNA endonuclease-like protein
MTWKYIAGFFDGEGSICHNGKGFRITIAQTNLEVLNEIQKFAQVGFVFEVRKRQPHWKDCWIYYIARQQHVHDFLINMLDDLIVKRDQTQEVIKKLEITLIQQRQRVELREYRFEKATELRKQGLTYRQIGKEINVDFGYIRRLILGKKLRGG